MTGKESFLTSLSRRSSCSIHHRHQAGDPARLCWLQLASLSFIIDCPAWSSRSSFFVKVCSKAVNQKWFKSFFFPPLWPCFFHLSLWLRTFLCCSKNLHAFLPPFSIIVPLDPKVDGRANWVWLKQDVLNLFVPSVSGLRYWTALIAVMVYYISEVFHSRENWHVPYMKIHPTPALKLGGHLFLVKAKESSRHCRSSWYWCQNMPLNYTLIKWRTKRAAINRHFHLLCTSSPFRLNTDIRKWL